MNPIQSGLLAFLPAKRKQTPSGWTSFNAPCCFHQGERPDTRSRGGVLLTTTGGFNYHCFNCNFKAGWTPGHNLTKNTRNLFKWLGMSELEINKLVLTTLQFKDQPQSTTEKILNFDLLPKDLPDDCLPITTWIEENCTDPEFLGVLDYIKYRGFELDDYPWHWSAAPGYTKRVIIPFYYQDQIVGWTGRTIEDNRKPKYLTHVDPGYVFNMDRQHYSRKYALVVEGQFDAIAVDGVALMHNDMNEIQAARINALNRKIIAVPDRDRAGIKMIDYALKYNWTISIPPWDTNIKDVADAAKMYGKLYTLASILHYQESNPLKIEIIKTKLTAQYG